MPIPIMFIPPGVIPPIMFIPPGVIPPMPAMPPMPPGVMPPMANVSKFRFAPKAGPECGDLLAITKQIKIERLDTALINYHSSNLTKIYVNNH